MSGSLTCWSSCLDRDSFPLSLAQSMMIRSITLVLFRPGNIQPSTLYRIPHCLSHALHSTTHLHDTSNVWQTGRRMVQDEAPAADIFGSRYHEMDGDVCSCLPLQLAELVPTTVCVRIECATARVVLLGHCTLCNNEAELVCRQVASVTACEHSLSLFGYIACHPTRHLGPVHT